MSTWAASVTFIFEQGVNLICSFESFGKVCKTAFSIFIKNSRNVIPKYEHITVPHASCNVEHQNEADKTFVATKYIDCLVCNISIMVHGVICSIILRGLYTFLLRSQNNLMKFFVGQFIT